MNNRDRPYCKLLKKVPRHGKEPVPTISLFHIIHKLCFSYYLKMLYFFTFKAKCFMAVPIWTIH